MGYYISAFDHFLQYLFKNFCLRSICKQLYFANETHEKIPDAFRYQLFAQLVV